MIINCLRSKDGDEMTWRYCIALFMRKLCVIVALTMRYCCVNYALLLR